MVARAGQVSPSHRKSIRAVQSARDGQGMRNPGEDFHKVPSGTLCACISVCTKGAARPCMVILSESLCLHLASRLHRRGRSRSRLSCRRSILTRRDVGHARQVRNLSAGRVGDVDPGMIEQQPCGGHRPDKWHRLHVHSRRNKWNWDRGRLVAFRSSNPGGPSGGADQCQREPRRRAGDRQLDCSCI